MKSLHRAKDYNGLVQLIKKSMNIDVQLVVGWVNSGGPRTAPAWVMIPENMPYYGTPAFQRLKLTIYIRKSFIEESTYDQAAIVIAHELSHIVLNSIGHPLRKLEKAVDLTAMLLGFRLLYKCGCYKERRFGYVTSSRKIGYLSQAEVDLASDILAGNRWRCKIPLSLRPVSALVATLVPIVFFGSVIAALNVWPPIYNSWKLHEALVAEQTALQKRLPLTLNHYALTDVRVGFRYIARLYNLTVPERDIDFAAVERAVRKLSCNSDNKAKIRDGATYTYEFRDSRQLVRKFDIASCA